jgi:hypothetical protein
MRILEFAFWVSGEDPEEGLKNYFINVLDFLNLHNTFRVKRRKPQF